MLNPKQNKKLHADKKHSTPHPTLPGRAASGRILATTAPAMPKATAPKPPAPKAVKPAAPQLPAKMAPMSNILPTLPPRPAIKTKRKK